MYPHEEEKKMKDFGVSPLYKEVGIPTRFHNLLTATYPGNPLALKSVQVFLADFAEEKTTKLGLFLRGGPRTCKTFLATYALRSVYTRWNWTDIRYWSLDDIMDYHFKASTPGQFNKLATGPRFIVVDNVNVPRHEGQKSALARFIRLRSDSGLPYILVSQLSSDIFAKLYCRFSLVEEGQNTVLADEEIKILTDSDLKVVSCSLPE